MDFGKQLGNFNLLKYYVGWGRDSSDIGPA
jgi:hypothetical protein